MEYNNKLYEKLGLTETEKEFDNLEEKARNETTEVFTSENAEGKTIIGAMKDGRECYFNSRYSDNELIENWCNRYDIESYRTIALVFGMANGEYIRSLRRKNREMLIIVYEPSYSVAYINRNMLSADDLVSDENMIIVLGTESMKGVYQILASVVEYEVLKYLKLYVTPNYDNVFAEEYKKLKALYDECVMRVAVNRNTVIAIGREITTNTAGNLIDCIEQYSIQNLIKAFENVDKKDIPAIIVAAGPSLDKNIAELRNAKGKAFIIAVDTALNPMARAGIMPDIAVTVDPHKPLVLFENENMREIPMLFGLCANAAIKDIHKGMRIYQGTNGSILNKYIKEYGKTDIRLETGGSVAHDAFSLARILGFKTIIFIGQDLAYPNDREHSEASYGTKAHNDINRRKKEYFEVEDIYGGKVKTEYNMNMYRIWFERAVVMYDKLKFIDATEGGAKKEGMEIMTLHDAIERECKSEEYIDFGTIIGGIEPTFDEQQKKHIYEELCDLDKMFDDIKKKLADGKRAYDKLDEFNRKQKYSGKEFERAVEKITEINNWMAEDREVEYLNMYAAEKDYQVRGTVFDVKDNTYEEIKHITDEGRKMMDALTEAADMASADMRETVQLAGKKLGR